MADNAVVPAVQYIAIAKAAESLGISKRRALEYAQAGALRSVRQRDPATSQVGVMVSVTDVEKLREERENPRPLTPARQYEAGRKKAGERDRAEPQTSAHNWPPPLYLTLEQAMRYTGLGESELRRCAKGAPRGPRGALVYKRADLEAL